MEHECRPPRRGTWIEISIYYHKKTQIAVVPRVGGRGLKLHDKDSWDEDDEVVPRVGGRGLKYLTLYQ